MPSFWQQGRWVVARGAGFSPDLPHLPIQRTIASASALRHVQFGFPLIYPACPSSGEPASNKCRAHSRISLRIPSGLPTWPPPGTPSGMSRPEGPLLGSGHFLQQCGYACPFSRPVVDARPLVPHDENAAFKTVGCQPHSRSPHSTDPPYNCKGCLLHVYALAPANAGSHCLT